MTKAIKEDDITFVLLFGHIELDSWLKWENGKLIGMGSKKTYDEHGNLLSYEESPTGVVAYLA